MKLSGYLGLLAILGMLGFSPVAICSPKSPANSKPAVDPNLALLIVRPSGPENDDYSRTLAIELALILDGFQIQRAKNETNQSSGNEVEDLWKAGIQNRAGFVIYVNVDKTEVKRFAMVVLYGDRALAKSMDLHSPKEEPESLTLLVRQLTDEALVFLENVDQSAQTDPPPEGWVELKEETEKKERVLFELGALASVDVALIDEIGHWGWAGGGIDLTLLMPVGLHFGLELSLDSAQLTGSTDDQLSGSRFNGTLYFGKHWTAGRFRFILDLGLGGSYCWFTAEPGSGSTTEPDWFDFKIKMRGGVYFNVSNSVHFFLNAVPALIPDRDQITIPSDSSEKVIYQAPWIELGARLGLSVTFN